MFNETEYQEKARELLIDAQEHLDFVIRRDNAHLLYYATEKEYEEMLKKWQYIVARLKKWYAKIYVQQVKEMVECLGVNQDVRDEMDGDMEDSGMAQGEIESCLNHWNNKYLIIKK